MSGGYFSYNQFRINEITESVEDLLENSERLEDYSNLVEQDVKALKDLWWLSFILTQRLDWLLSGDDSEDTYYKRQKEDLKNSSIDFYRLKVMIDSLERFKDM